MHHFLFSFPGGLHRVEGLLVCQTVGSGPGRLDGETLRDSLEKRERKNVWYDRQLRWNIFLVSMGGGFFNRYRPLGRRHLLQERLPTHRQFDLRAQQATPRRPEPDGANGQFLVKKLYPMVGLWRRLRVFVVNRFWLFPGIPDVAVGVLWQ